MSKAKVQRAKRKQKINVDRFRKKKGQRSKVKYGNVMKGRQSSVSESTVWESQKNKKRTAATTITRSWSSAMQEKKPTGRC